MMSIMMIMTVIVLLDHTLAKLVGVYYFACVCVCLCLCVCLANYLKNIEAICFISYGSLPSI